MAVMFPWEFGVNVRNYSMWVRSRNMVMCAVRMARLYCMWQFYITSIHLLKREDGTLQNIMYVVICAIQLS